MPRRGILKSVEKESNKGKEKRRVKIYSLSSQNFQVKTLNIPPDQEFPDNNRVIFLPMGFDMHVHLRTPGETHKEDITTGIRAAIHGGIGRIADMPNTKPPITTIELLEKKIELVKATPIPIMISAAITNDNLTEIKEIAAKADFLKIFMAESHGNLSLAPSNLEKVLKILTQEHYHKPLVFHPEDPSLIQTDVTDPLFHDEARPEQAEVRAVEQLVKLAKQFPKLKIHATHLTTPQAIQLILRNKAQGITNISFDVTPKHLAFSKKDIRNHPELFKMNPPIRSESTVLKIQEFLKTGKIEIVASDHAPHTLEEKKSKTPPSGAPAIQEMYPFLIDCALKKRITFPHLVNMIYTNPMKLFNLNHLEPRDYVIIDIKSHFTLTKKEIYTKVKWSLWEGYKFQGKILGLARQQENNELVYYSFAEIVPE